MDGLTSKNGTDKKELSKKEKAALKKLEKEKQKKEKEKLKQEKALQKQREKEAKKLGTGKTTPTTPPPTTTPPPQLTKSGSSNDINRAPAPLKKQGSGAALSAVPDAGKDGLDPSLPSLLGNKVKRRRPRKFKEKEFNQILESVRSGSFTGMVLDLNNRYLDKYAAADLAKVLATNSTITELNISNNEIGDDGVVPLSRMLEKNKTIRILDVQFNMLTRKGTKHLLTCLNNNVFITELYMDEREVNLGDMFVNTDTALESIGADVRERIDKLVTSNKNFQLLLEGKSNSLELPDRSQSYVNTHILERFPDLGNIDLRKNKLKFIPEEIGLLKRLEQLLLSDNKIEKLPNQIGELPNLRILDLANNSLSELPLALTTLPKLKHLYLQNNRFNDLPRFSLGSMKSLMTLDIRGNPLAQMSCMGSSFMDVVEQGGRETLSFLRENNKGMAEVYRMKLMFVGNGNVGKTTLLGHFIKQKSRLPAGGHASTAAAMKDSGANATRAQPGSQIRAPKVPKTLENVATDGIDIHKWNYKHPGKSWVTKPGAEHINEDELKEKYINFSCWDFAGQEVYYATHSFFLSQRAIYILVFNLLEPEETNQIEYWLQSINARTEGSPIIMVGTHSEDKRCTQEYIQLYFGKIMEKYGQRFRNHIVSMHAISNVEKNSGIPELREKIIKVALNQDYMPDRIALSFLALEEKLMGAQQTLNPPVLSFSEYSSMALDCNISENNVLTATKFLNDLGSLVYFSDKDEGLNDLVVVDPQWITKTFATVVSLKFSFIRDGIMKISDLPFIWAAPNYPPELHPKLIAMLQKLGIISKLKHEGEDKILIPCLLPENPPVATVMDEVWPAFEEHHAQAGRIYTFEFVPLGFFSRLIVRFLVSQYEPVLYWKRGIILKKDSEKIKLTMIKDSKVKNFPMTMELWVRGPSPGRHLLDLVDNIDTLVEDWLRVKYERYVPCVHCVKEGSQDPYLFPLRVVEQSFADNHASVRCRGITDVPIAMIAPDVAMSEFEGSVVKLSDIVKGKMIGEGGFAKVYKAIWNNQVIALKELTLDSSATTEAIGFEFEDATDPLAVFAEFRKEVSLMSDMKHPNIVNLLGLCMDPFCMLLEFCGQGCLYDYIHDVDNKPLNWPIALKLAEDVAKGMHFMHTYTPPLIHRDLKSPNILLSVEPDQTGTPMIIAKVADFGLSRKLMLAGQLKSKVVDNPVWLAPEMMRKEDYDEKVDVYSYGVILWELVARKDFLGHITFLSAIEDAVLNGERPVIPEACVERFPEYASLIQRCWADKPKERPDFGYCLQVLAKVKKERLPLVPDKMPPWKLEVVAPETIRAERNQQQQAPPPKPAEAPSERTTTSVPITKHRQPQRKAALDDENEPRASPEVMAIVHGGDRTTKTLLPFARGRGTPTRGRPLPNPGPGNGPRAARPHAETQPPPSSTSVETRDRSGSWQRGVRSSLRLLDGPDVQVSSFERNLESVGAPITVMITFGDVVWTATAAGRTIVWDTKSGTKLKEIAMHSQAVMAMILVQQKEVWTTSTDNSLKIWNLEGDQVGELPIKAAGYSLLEDPNTHLVWVGCNVQNAPKKQPPEFGAIQVWDPVAKRQKKAWRLEPFVIAGSGDVNAVSPIPKCMLYHMNHVFVGAGPRLLCFEPQTFAAQGYMEDHTGEVTLLISLGDEIWSAGRDKLVKVWNPKERGSDCIATMEGHGGEVIGLSADAGGHMWSCGWDKKIFVWDAGEVKRFITFLPTQHTKSLTALLLTTYNEGGKQVKKMWSASLDGTIGLWRFDTFLKVY